MANSNWENPSDRLPEVACKLFAATPWVFKGTKVLFRPVVNNQDDDTRFQGLFALASQHNLTFDAVKDTGIQFDIEELERRVPGWSDAIKNTADFEQGMAHYRALIEKRNRSELIVPEIPQDIKRLFAETKWEIHDDMASFDANFNEGRSARLKQLIEACKTYLKDDYILDNEGTFLSIPIEILNKRMPGWRASSSKDPDAWKDRPADDGQKYDHGQYGNLDESWLPPTQWKPDEPLPFIPNPPDTSPPMSSRRKTPHVPNDVAKIFAETLWQIIPHKRGDDRAIFHSTPEDPKSAARLKVLASFCEQYDIAYVATARAISISTHELDDSVPGWRKAVNRASRNEAREALMSDTEARFAEGHMWTPAITNDYSQPTSFMVCRNAADAHALTTLLQKAGIHHINVEHKTGKGPKLFAPTRALRRAGIEEYGDDVTEPLSKAEEEEAARNLIAGFATQDPYKMIQWEPARHAPGIMVLACPQEIGDAVVDALLTLKQTDFRLKYTLDDKTPSDLPVEGRTEGMVIAIYKDTLDRICSIPASRLDNADSTPANPSHTPEQGL